MIPDKVHLVGSIGLDSVPEVFRTAGKLLGRRLRRIPDGEPGGRRLWISWQYPLLRANPFLKVSPQPPENATGFLRLCLADGVGPGDVQFGELGYAREARASYEDFKAARKAGEIPKGARFQVSLPTPLAVIVAFCPGTDMFAIERAYEKAMIREVRAICAAIPHEDLCLQWDVCLEMLMWDGQLTQWTPFENLEREITGRMKRISAPIPRGVELGIHLCYGDWEARHFVQPLDAGKMVDIANALVKAIAHPLAYLHIPVPIDRTDDAFFQPLHNLKLRPGTELCLGVVHAADGTEGVKRRIAVASKYVSDFGIATECGMARSRTPDVVMSLLKIHAAGSREPGGTAHKHRSQGRSSSTRVSA